MKAKEVIEMFLKGKTPAEIREVHELEKEIAQEEEKKAEELTKIFVKEPAKKEPKEEKGTEKEEPKADEGPEAQLEEMKKRIAELETQLKEAQDANTKKDMSEGVTPAEERKAIIDNMVRSFM